MRKNPQSFVVGVSSPKGVVKVFSPNSQEPLLQILAHNAPVTSLDFSRDGNYLLTAGGDCRFKIWDIRNSYHEVFSYSVPWKPTDVRFSQTGLAAVASGHSVFFWKDAQLEKQKGPYFRHDDLHRKQVTGCAFAPYEDFMGVCHDAAFESIFVPGSGSRDFDTFEDNLNTDRRQNREIVVQKLLQKVR